MAGIYLVELLGAFVRWMCNGFQKPYKYFLENSKEQSMVPKNFIIGLVTFYLLLIILFI